MGQDGEANSGWSSSRSLPVGGIGPAAHLALAWRRAPGPALRAFTGHCRTAFARELAAASLSCG